MCCSLLVLHNCRQVHRILSSLVRVALSPESSTVNVDVGKVVPLVVTHFTVAWRFFRYSIAMLAD